MIPSNAEHYLSRAADTPTPLLSLIKNHSYSLEDAAKRLSRTMVNPKLISLLCFKDSDKTKATPRGAPLGALSNFRDGRAGKKKLFVTTINLAGNRGSEILPLH